MFFCWWWFYWWFLLLFFNSLFHPRYVLSAEIYMGYSYYFSPIFKDKIITISLFCEKFHPHIFPSSISVINLHSHPISIHSHTHKYKQELRKHTNILNCFILQNRFTIKISEVIYIWEQAILQSRDQLQL